MREPYNVMIRAMQVFKAAGLRIPAATRGDKQRLLNYWVQRYGAADGTAFLAAVRRLAAGRYFPRFCDMDAALREQQRAQSLRTGREAEPGQEAALIDREGNQRRVHELIERLAQRRLPL